MKLVHAPYQLKIDFHENKKEFAFSLEIQNKDSNIRNITMQRIINNSKYLNYYGRVHEYVKSTSKNGQFALCHTNIVVFHHPSPSALRLSL